MSGFETDMSGERLHIHIPCRIRSWMWIPSVMQVPGHSARTSMAWYAVEASRVLALYRK